MKNIKFLNNDLTKHKEILIKTPKIIRDDPLKDSKPKILLIIPKIIKEEKTLRKIIYKDLLSIYLVIALYWPVKIKQIINKRIRKT